MITIFDTETTGLLRAKGTDINLQPYFTEIYAMQVDEDGTLIRDFHSLIKPPIPLSDIITKITGLTDGDLKDAPIFVEIFKKLTEVFLGSHTVVAHNLPFDEGMLVNELKRIGKQYHFPYPPIKFCTMERSIHIKGHRIKNTELYKLATDKEIEGAHRAKADVFATFESYKWLVAKGGK